MGLSRGTTCLELESTKGIRGTIGRSGRATTISGSVSTSRGYGNMVDRVTRIRVHRVVGRIIGGGVRPNGPALARRWRRSYCLLSGPLRAGILTSS